MKILLIGFLAFSSWSSLSICIYVCKIKGLCDEPKTIQMEVVAHKDIIAGDTMPKSLIQHQAGYPENLTIHFAFDKSEFNADAKTDKYFDESNAYLEQNLQSRLSITGHTDATGTNEYNQALGYRRAQSLQHYFESRGIPAKRIIIESRGEKEPAADNNTTAGRANNRRTEITIKK